MIKKLHLNAKASWSKIFPKIKQENNSMIFLKNMVKYFHEKYLTTNKANIMDLDLLVSKTNNLLKKL